MSNAVLYTFVIKPWADGAGHDYERHAAVARQLVLGLPPTARLSGLGALGVEFVSAVLRDDGQTADVTYSVPV